MQTKHRDKRRTNKKSQKAAGLGRDATGRADGLEFLLDADARLVLT